MRLWSSGYDRGFPTAFVLINNSREIVSNPGSTPGSRILIPHVPFNIEVRWSEMQPPTVWAFKENNEVIVDYGTQYAEYASYENGWISWVKGYKIIPPKYNPETQKYELK
jgi:hypothetical protein